MEKDTNQTIQSNALLRIADALEEVIRMVKKDQQETRARFEERWDKEDKEAAQWAAVPAGPWLRYTYSTRAGSRIRDRATSNKRQAASVKLQAWQDEIKN